MYRAAAFANVLIFEVLYCNQVNSVCLNILKAAIFTIGR